MGLMWQTNCGLHIVLRCIATNDRIGFFFLFFNFIIVNMYIIYLECFNNFNYKCQRYKLYDSFEIQNGALQSPIRRLDDKKFAPSRRTSRGGLAYDLYPILLYIVEGMYSKQSYKASLLLLQM